MDAGKYRIEARDCGWLSLLPEFCEDEAHLSRLEVEQARLVRDLEGKFFLLIKVS